jgi:hypothetical protein
MARKYVGRIAAGQQGHTGAQRQWRGRANGASVTVSARVATTGSLRSISASARFLTAGALSASRVRRQRTLA